MPETATETPPAAPPATPVTPPVTPPAEATGETPVYAGKFKGPQPLEQANRELTTKLGMEPLPEGPLFGPGRTFKDVLALERDYIAKERLQGKLGDAAKPKEVTPPAPETKPPQTPAELAVKPAVTTETPASTKKGYAKVLELAGLANQEDALVKQWDEKGELTPEQYAAFAKTGRDREEVDSVLEGEAAKRDVAKGRVTSMLAEGEKVAGGKQQHDTLRDWASKNIDRVTLDRWGKQLMSDPEFYPDMVRLIDAEYKSKNGSANSRPLVNGGTAPAVTGGAYSDPAEYRAVLAKINAGTATDVERARFADTPVNLALR